MNSTSYNIALIPSNPITDLAVTTSQKLEGFDSQFTLHEGSYYPHLSLYMVKITSADIEYVREVLGTLSRQLNTVELSALRYSQSRGYIDIEYTRTHQIDSLQMRIAQAINALRDDSDDMSATDKIKIRMASAKERTNVEKYGYDALGELFRPHVTLTRLRNEQEINIAGLPQPYVFTGTFEKLGLFEMGDNGTCVRKIAVWDLRNQIAV